MKIIITCLISIFASPILYAQSLEGIGEDWKKYISLDQYLQPFLVADTIYDELVMPISEQEGLIQGSLLFPAKSILRIRNTYLDKNYEKGIDWDYQDGKLFIPKTSKIPFFRRDELLLTEEKKGASLPGKQKGTFVLFSEGELLRSKQIAVTYVPNKSNRDKGLKLTMTRNLPLTSQKLKKNKQLHVVFWGNSIETGANSSAFQKVAPFMPDWAKLFIYNLRRSFSDQITFKNLAVGGMAASWGLDQVGQVIEEKPDLVVIGFGMNDGTAGVPEKTFLEQIKGMISKIRASNPNCEFIIINTMVANPASIHNNIQTNYRSGILAMQGKGIAVADMTYWHQWLLNYKAYEDMTGNNINHTNDYLSRWYAQVLSSLLIQVK
ncbi:SGNH/GDSL hydrolase family protein [Sphingobacterium sp. HJSM2_6]|uniref:SGNH/GDSL hydrolase family protein n=1 Tax=Sphingobacterium sp. HJSM2_6 TaxID=3366264 RepID=UPI003BCDD50A